MKKTTVAVVSNDQQSAKLLHLMLETQSNISTIHCVTTTQELASLLAKDSTDVALVDVTFPVPNMADTIHKAKRIGLRTAYVGMVSGDDTNETLLAEMDALFPKEGSLSCLAKLLHNIHAAPGNLNQFRVEQPCEIIPCPDKTTSDDTSTSDAINDTDTAQTRTSYVLSVETRFSASHKITFRGQKGVLHTHRWTVRANFRQESLDQDHFLLGFGDAKQILRAEVSWLDGAVLNNLPPFAEIPPTSENVAALVYKNLEHVLKSTPIIIDSVTIWESPTNAITYTEV